MSEYTHTHMYLLPISLHMHIFAYKNRSGIKELDFSSMWNKITFIYKK